MQGAQSRDTPELPKLGDSPLEYLHGLLTAPADGPQDLPALLMGLARAFAAASAGLASLTDGSTLLWYPTTNGATPPRRPWQDDPTLLLRARETITAFTFDWPGRGEYLLTTVCPPGLPGWLLWVEGFGMSGWTEADASALALAGSVLGRFLIDRSLRGGWAAQLERLARRQHLEIAARVTRRLAHDFGNVLTGILGFSDLSLSEVEEDRRPLHKFLTELHQSALNGVRFIERLRQFAHHSAHPRAAALLGPALAREEARLLKLGDGVARLQRDLPDDLPALAIDADNLSRVLEIVVDNAREATLPGGGPIRVTARVVTLSENDCLEYYGDPRPGSHVVITVADEGSGLSAEAERRLFAELFFTTKSRRRGLGLLAAYGILRCHRGGLDVANRVEGGALARVVVPVVPQSAGGAAYAGEAALATRGEAILVVDDDPLVLQFVSTTLGQAGYRVRATSSSREALKLYTASPESYRLVVSDVLMPEVNGFDLARQLHARDSGVRLLFMSGHLAPELRGADAGGYAFDLLLKPFRPEALLRAVRAAIDRAPSRQAPGRKGSASGDG